MSYDRDEFLATVTKRAGERTANMMPLLRAAQAVAPIMEKLTTGNAPWDRYLQHLQAYVEQAQAAKANAQAKQSDPAIWDPNVLAKLKGDIIAADAMIEAWVTAMQLPRMLIQGGDEATAQIARFQEKERENATGQSES